jgi:hypothetical protein
LPSLNDFQKKVIETISGYDFSKIIFNLRFNGGGNSGQGTELIKALLAIKI